MDINNTLDVNSAVLDVTVDLPQATFNPPIRLEFYHYMVNIYIQCKSRNRLNYNTLNKINI